MARSAQWALLLGTIVMLAHAAGCGRSRVPVPLVPQSVVIGRFAHFEVSADDRTSGLDLDGRVSNGGGTSCADALDFTSWLTGARGVDNQYAAYLLPLIGPPGPACGGGRGWWGSSTPCPEPTDLFGTAILETQLALGVGLIGLEVSVEPVAVGSTEAPRVLVTLSELLATSALRIEDGALAPGARLVPRRIEIAEARLEGRTLRVTFARMLIPVGTTAGLQPIENVTLELSLDEAGRLTDGELGGRVTLETVLDVARLITGTPGVDESTARALANPDLDPDESGVCQRVSIGLGLELVPFEVFEER